MFNQMKTNKLILLFAVFALVAGLTSCSKDADDEAPAITQVRINGAAPSDHIHVDAGSEMTLQVTMTDNEELNQLKIDIHPNSDGHSHDGEDHDHGGSAEGDWEVLEVINLSGTSQTVNRSFVLPDDIRGGWHLGILVIDKEGNEAEERYYELEVENDIIPLITVDQINGSEPGDELHVDEGDVITFAGSITDDNGLDHIHVEIYDEDGNEVMEQEYDAAGALSWDLSQISLTFPAMPTEHGELKIHVHDIDDHHSEWEIHVHAH